MSHCLPLDCHPHTPVPLPTPLPPCEAGEPCSEVVDAGCVVYTNEALPAINVQPNDRLNDILRNLALSAQNGTQAISTQQTLTTAPSGNGTATNPLKVNVRVSTYPRNLLKTVDYVDEFNTQRTGLQVVLDTATIGWVLHQIAQTEELRIQFCDLLNLCAYNACNITTDLAVTPAG